MNSLPRDRIGVVLLAAGAGQRFGGDKLSHQLIDGDLLLERTLKLYRGLPNLTIVVANEELQQISRAYSNDVILCEENERGMSYSLKLGLQRNENLGACMICLGDMCCVPSAIIEELLALAKADKIIAPRLKQNGKWRQGNPVVFGRDFFPELMQLEGDVGGKQVLKQQADAVIWLDSNDEGILFDVDHESDLERLSCL